MPKILFITSIENDYLQDSLLHGFKSLFGKEVIEYPVKPQLYNDFQSKDSLYGKGFTIYCTLPAEMKHSIDNPLENPARYDIVVFSSIHRQYKIFNAIKSKINLSRTLIFDGEDETCYFTSLYSFRKDIANTIKAFISIIHQKYYFKRELTSDTYKGFFYKISNLDLKFIKNIHPISFSIPYEKIVKKLPSKTKLFPCHIVDEEVATKVENAQTRYAFKNESDYYKDLQSSKFGITTKRAGWDCMRHYEIAANGAVICFRDFDKKEESCAPHGLNQSNCISYKDYDDLMFQINRLTEDQYKKLLDNSLIWIRNNTTKRRVDEIIRKTGLLNG